MVEGPIPNKKPPVEGETRKIDVASLAGKAGMWLHIATVAKQAQEISPDEDGSLEKLNRRAAQNSAKMITHPQGDAQTVTFIPSIAELLDQRAAAEHEAANLDKDRTKQHREKAFELGNQAHALSQNGHQLDDYSKITDYDSTDIVGRLRQIAINNQAAELAKTPPTFWSRIKSSLRKQNR